MKPDHPQDEPSSIQVNIGEHQRNAGRDFVEVILIQSTEVFLETAPEEVIDEKTLHNPRLFKRRFGIEIANPEVRANTLALRRKMKLTDSEMRGLRKAGHLLLQPEKVELQPSRLSTFFGQFQLLLLSLFCAMCILQIALGSAPESKRLLGQLCFAAIWFGGTGVLHRLYIEPARVLKRIGA